MLAVTAHREFPVKRLHFPTSLAAGRAGLGGRKNLLIIFLSFSRVTTFPFRSPLASSPPPAWRWTYGSIFRETMHPESVAHRTTRARTHTTKCNFNKVSIILTTEQEKHN